jgi:hypothetical protein
LVRIRPDPDPQHWVLTPALASRRAAIKADGDADSKIFQKEPVSIQFPFFDFLLKGNLSLGVSYTVFVYIPVVV